MVAWVLLKTPVQKILTTFLLNCKSLQTRVAQNHKAFAKICPIVKFRTFLESLDHSTSKSF